MTVRALGVSALFAASIAAVAYAQAPALKINLGAWEFSTAVDMSGQMPGADTSKMTPEQKARMDAMMQAMQGRGSQPPRIRKTCVTKENFQKGTWLQDNEPDMKCTQTFAANTATTLDATRTCTGENASRTEHLRVDATSPSSFKANATNISTMNGRTMNVKVVMTGKWLGADCSGIK